MAVRVIAPPRGPGGPRTLLLMAQLAVRDIRRRAFPTDGRAGRTPEGKAFARLSPNYAKWKAKKGRPPVPDQRFTSGTANALGVVKRTPTSVAIGWRERRQVADALNRRNAFWGLSQRELRAVRRVAEQAGREFARSVRVTGSVVVRLT